MAQPKSYQGQSKHGRHSFLYGSLDERAYMPYHAVAHTYQLQTARGGTVEREQLVLLVRHATAELMVEG
jgi:hypothetical protein